ncbi:MAG: TlyA family RNA methyltransferase [Ruminococcaceae bacterium]|nr:TlyA family RNA methyltransferase [Oscillospiraceae bacterium]
MIRVDVYLTQNGFCESRNKAAKLIEQGLISIDGQNISKVSEHIDEISEHEVIIKEHDGFVGRGGLKLEAALERFDVEIANCRFIDVGASTGGFTQCLLQHGAKSVVAVDSGKGQLHKSLLEDDRVTSVEGFNARYIDAAKFGMFDGAVMDVSFISQTLIIPSLAGVLHDGGIFISLIKPQFEAGRAAIGKNGIVKKASDREMSILRVLECAGACGFSLKGIMRSPIQGGDGNVEFLACFIKSNEGTVLSDQIKTSINRLCRE